jgi:hypothetical protein
LRFFFSGGFHLCRVRFAATQSEKDEIVAKVNEVGAMLEKEARRVLKKSPPSGSGKDNYVYVGDMNCTFIAPWLASPPGGQEHHRHQDDTGNKFMAKLLEA